MLTLLFGYINFFILPHSPRSLFWFKFSSRSALGCQKFAANLRISQLLIVMPLRPFKPPRITMACTKIDLPADRLGPFSLSGRHQPYHTVHASSRTHLNSRARKAECDLQVVPHWSVFSGCRYCNRIASNIYRAIWLKSF